MVDEALRLLWKWRQQGRIDERYAEQWERVLRRPLRDVRRIIGEGKLAVVIAIETRTGPTIIRCQGSTLIEATASVHTRLAETRRRMSPDWAAKREIRDRRFVSAGRQSPGNNGYFPCSAQVRRVAAD